MADVSNELRADMVNALVLLALHGMEQSPTAFSCSELISACATLYVRACQAALQQGASHQQILQGVQQMVFALAEPSGPIQ